MITTGRGSGIIVSKYGRGIMLLNLPFGHANLGDHPSPGLVCQECHRLIDRPLAVNRCPLCKVDLHTDCLDVHFLLDHQISFERWNKNTLEASLQFALHSAPMAAASSSGCGPQPPAQTWKNQCNHSTVAEKQLAVRLIRARKAGSLSSEQEDVLRILAQDQAEATAGSGVH